MLRGSLGAGKSPDDRDALMGKMHKSHAHFMHAIGAGPDPQKKYHPMAINKEEVEQVDEKLTPKQKKLDKDHNGKLDKEDFKLLRKEETVAESTEEPKLSVFASELRYRGVESSIRDILSQNQNLRKTHAEETWKKNNPSLYNKE